MLPPVAYAGFCKGGGGPENSKNLRRTKFRMKIISPKISPNSCPKSVEDQKKRSSLKFCPIFCPKSGEDQKKRGLHSIFLQFFAKIWVQANNKGLRLPFVCSNLLLNLQRRGMPQFCILFYANYTIQETQRSHGPIALL